jgi:hypothetical protein
MCPPNASGISTEHWSLRFDSFRNFGSPKFIYKAHSKIGLRGAVCEALQR